MGTVRFSIAVIAIFVGYIWTMTVYAPGKSPEVGVRAWDWAQDYCRDYGGVKEFRVVRMRKAAAMCEEKESAVRQLR